MRSRPGGRSARVRQSVINATLALLREGGLDRPTIADVAQRAEVHETTIRRRWPTKESLICDVLLSNSEQHLPIPDTGSLREDLVAFASDLAAYLATPLGRALIRAMARTGEDPALARARAVFWETRYDLASTMMKRAIAGGEIPATVDGRLILEALIAPLNFRALLTDEPTEDDLPRRLASLVIGGIEGGGETQPAAKR